jgi:hypothetical protein
MENAIHNVPGQPSLDGHVGNDPRTLGNDGPDFGQ